MTRILLLALALTASCAVARGGDPRTIDVSPSLRTASEVTVYADGRALVRERFRLTLQNGMGQLAFRHLPQTLDPDSVLLSGEGVEVLAMEYDTHLLTPQRLLRAHVGDLVRIIRIDPATGEEVSQAAEILSVTAGLVVRIGDRIVANPEGQIVYSRVPDDLQAGPVFRALVRGRNGRQSVDLVYLARGLAWRAEYTGRLDPEGSSLHLTGWAAVENAGAHDYGEVALALVAGEVRDAGAAPVMPRSRAMASAAPPAPEQLAGAYRIYRFEQPWRLAPHSIQRRPLVTPRTVRVARRYVISGDAHRYTSRAGAGPERQHAVLRLDFANTAEAGLGTPLPAGRVRVYGQDTEGGVRLLGADRLSHVPEGGAVRLTLGRAFDVWAERRQTDYRMENAPSPHRRRYTTAHEIRLHNALERPVAVWVEERLPGQWTILDESARHERLDARTVRWSVEIPARGVYLLTYTARVVQ
jgi:hypothetical protein